MTFITQTRLCCYGNDEPLTVFVTTSVTLDIGKKLGNVTITTTHPSGTLGADCCSPHRLNNPTLNPSPDPAALIGPGLRGSRHLIGGAAEQQAAGWSVRPPTEATPMTGHMEQ